MASPYLLCFFLVEESNENRQNSWMESFQWDHHCQEISTPSLLWVKLIYSIETGHSEQYTSSLILRNINLMYRTFPNLQPICAIVLQQCYYTQIYWVLWGGSLIGWEKLVIISCNYQAIAWRTRNRLQLCAQYTIILLITSRESPR